ncbi:zinc/manganese transport system substrate-binding protein [Saccharopolyspora erythraea NRRL 2338]|uniref:ABC-type transporter n=2 Tax=Saccharopolyspora erythraea TaxID=1836 RepID=A4F6X7_SACEN|nr:zinc ABC transporter substrate-binding protein [Saccharopolyspora erythraea]EQD85458.1 ABC transporter [Saccharopolyspora erythraea D]PFG93602.1 zinc/manganese transport system substrate-binding protein [Saccharopolyspora erythraea NRRL 2338]QRK90450.1 zinc ABC transporter substrate-binding protein [Saccharopolyspora erythraea]CAL99801.1 ABC-type transporter [Saccharopolyspora erythraea NRRL 2338]
MTPSRPKTRRLPRTCTALVGVTAAALAMTGCGAGQQGSSAADGKVKVVASTSVWASVAQAVGGDHVEVEPLISDPNADPHSHESTPQDAAKVTDADLVILNGGGYDEFVEQILAGQPKPTVEAVSVPEAPHGEPGEGEQPPAPGEPAPPADEHDHGAPGEQPAPADEHGHAAPAPADEHEHGHDQPAPAPADDHGHAAPGEAHEHGHDHSGNEHVWYDLHLVHGVADRIAQELGKLQPANAQAFTGSAARFAQDVHGLEGRVEQIAAAHQGKKVIVTEPVAHYLIEDAKLTDITPPAFVNAIAAESDPSAAAVAEVQNAVRSGQAGALVYNPQTESPVTESVRKAAEENRIPVVEMTEVLPEGQTYVQWMDAQISALDAALNRKP